MPGSQADLLRALGRTLDERSASKFEIMNHEMFLAISWDVDGQSDGQTFRHYMEQDLDLLLEQAKEMRQGGVGGSGTPGALSELLRTLGQELDGEDVDVTAITQEADGFRVSGATGGKYYLRLYLLSDLLALSAKRRAERRQWVEHPEPLDPLPLVTVGLAVMTSDGKRLGKVKEVRGQLFKVETGFLQRDYWVPVRLVDLVRAGNEAHLNVSALEVEQHKSDGAPPPSSGS